MSGKQQLDVAKATGMHCMAVSAVERNSVPMPLKYMRLLREYLGIPREEFIRAYLADIGENIDAVLCGGDITRPEKVKVERPMRVTSVIDEAEELLPYPDADEETPIDEYEIEKREGVTHEPTEIEE